MLGADAAHAAHDWYAFTVAFKGVFLEGLEVAFIVVTIGGTQHSVGLAALGAAGALVVVLIAGVMVHAPLSPGAGEHAEVRRRHHAHVVRDLLGRGGCGRLWPGGEAAMLVVIVFVVALSLGLVAWLRRMAHPKQLAAA